MQEISNLIQPLIIMPIMFFFIYIFILRPQQKKIKKHEEMISLLKKGDEIITEGGIVGKIYNIDENFILLEISEKTKIKILKNSVQKIYKE